MDVWLPQHFELIIYRIKILTVYCIHYIIGTYLTQTHTYTQYKYSLDTHSHDLSTLRDIFPYDGLHGKYVH